ncbi:jhy protein homolog isoform X2 [Xyrichtys novacula]|uniref:Jhy protein homolog isoform X2 n=1 Tax=Xyrichtys novacula TaxID=13765 RepID=A0AAV1FVL2_XYRNO|nr:jhy protein homolog isoform X2 [Xyrichtys novacula]
MVTLFRSALAEESSQLLSDDGDSDLCCDLNWRSDLKSADNFEGSRQLTAVEHNPILKICASMSSMCSQAEVVLKGGYRLISDTLPSVEMTSPMTPLVESDQPYHLHPLDSETGSVIYPNSKDYTIQPRSEEAGLSSPLSSFTEDEEDKHAMHVQQCKIYNQQELSDTEAKTNTTQQTSPKVLSQRELEGLTKDFIKLNQVTGRRNKAGPNSYMMVHALKKEALKKEKVTECYPSGGQEDSSNNELKQIQTTQQLRITQTCKGKRVQQKERSSPPRQQQPPSLGIRAEQRNSLNNALARPTDFLQPNNNQDTHLPPFQQKGQAINPASGCPHWISASEAELRLSPPCLLKNQTEVTQSSQKGADLQLQTLNLDGTPKTFQRTTAWKWFLSCERVSERKSPNEVHFHETPHHLRTPSTTSLPGSSPYTVLPPIRKPLIEREAEMVPDQSVNTTDILQRSSSDSYLVQMERQKVFSLKAYEQLKTNVTLKGLDPSKKVIENTKLKRQKLYSNVIHEQNKKISRIPFLLAKDPQGDNKKVPRIKALEYARTVAKRSLQSQPKQRQRSPSGGSTGRSPYMEGLDVLQPAALDVLKKRHEEEKQAVALFKKVHAV